MIRNHLLTPLSAFVLQLLLGAFCRAEEMHLGASWHFFRIDQPCTIKNKGSKIIVGNIVNPTTGRWELVWGDEPRENTWMRDYLKLDDISDNIHNGGTLRILRPVSIAFVNFKGGELEIEIDQKPAIHITRKTGPTTGKKPDQILQPRVPKEPQTRQAASSNGDKPSN
jgi:hypothetical protein